jgi:hypothetical protein
VYVEEQDIFADAADFAAAVVVFVAPVTNVVFVAFLRYVDP